MSPVNDGTERKLATSGQNGYSPLSDLLLIALKQLPSRM